MRIDLLLVKLGYARSREISKQLIENGSVTFDGKTITKPSYDIDFDEDQITAPNITVSETPKYVSRGGYKLEGILAQGNINVHNKTCIDIGASTGGFTDCLLQNGAKKVYCVDSGTNQLAQSIADDERTVVLEKTNARTLTKTLIPDCIDIAVMDVSFISQTLIHEKISLLLDEKGTFISLIKPQFELTKSDIKKGGLVKGKAERHKAALRVISSCISNGMYPMLICDSSIRGGDGNIEYTAIFKKEPQNYNWQESVDRLS